MATATKTFPAEAEANFVLSLLVIFIFPTIFIPIIILNIIAKDTKGYLKKNYVTLLIFSLIACSSCLIPIVGKSFFFLGEVEERVEE